MDSGKTIIRLFGRTLSPSNTSPSQVPHNKPRIVRAYTNSPSRANGDKSDEDHSGPVDMNEGYQDSFASRYEEEEEVNIEHTSNPLHEEYSGEEHSPAIEIEEMTPGDPREATPTPPVASQSRASQSPRQYAVAIVTPKKSHVTKIARVPVNEEIYEEDEDADMDDGDYDEEEEAIEGPQQDPFGFLTNEYYTNPRKYTKGKGVLGKRSKGKSYGNGGKSPRGVGGKAPRGVGGKAPRVPSGLGKAPAISAKERDDQRRRSIILNDTPSNNNNNISTSKSKKRKVNPKVIRHVPVGKKPKRDMNAHLKEIKKMEKREKFMIPKSRFQNLVREIVQDDAMQTSWRWARSSLEALQCAAEEFLTELLDLGNVAAIHSKRRTLMVKDIALIFQIRPQLAALLVQWHAVTTHKSLV